VSADLVTGASGLLGANLTRALVARGRRVRLLLRPTARTDHLDDLDGLERVAGDVTRPADVLTAAEGVETIYHCAAAVSMDARQAATMWRVNVEGTDNVLAAARRVGARRLVHVSSVDAIGLPPPGAPPSTEEAPWNWDAHGVGNPYARTKLESQRRVLAATAEGLDAVVVNPTFMLGAYDVKPSSGRLILEVAAGKAVGYTTGGNNFVDVEDVVAGTLAAAERGRRGEVYILGGVNLTYREVMSEVAAVVGRAPPRLPIPYPVALAGGWCADLWARLRGRESVLNPLTARLGFVGHYYDPSKAVRELGLPRSPLRPAIERAVAWFRATGRLP
jgi:dihydroflavonol-4-reductase